MIPDLRPYADVKAAVGLARRGIAASRKPAARVGRRALGALASVLRLIWSGSRTLVGLIYGWLTGTYGTKGSILARFATAVAVLLGVAHTIGQFPAQGTVGAVWLWCQVAIMITRGLFDRLLGKAKGTQQAPGKTPAKDGDTAPVTRRKGLARWLRKTPESAPAEDVDQAPDEPPLTALIRELIGGDNGVHLSTLRPAMRERLPGLSEADNKHLRKVLVEAGYDPSRTFRARGVAGRAGVHRDELPPLLSPNGGQGTERNGSPPPEIAPDLRKSPHSPPPERRAESGRKGHRPLPEGWTDEDAARGYRWVNDASRGPSAWVVERREDVG
ncbi:hypothetical protein ACWEQC_21935 [Streptomyces shenzhenensis]